MAPLGARLGLAPVGAGLLGAGAMDYLATLGARMGLEPVGVGFGMELAAALSGARMELLPARAQGLEL